MFGFHNKLLAFTQVVDPFSRINRLGVNPTLFLGVILRAASFRFAQRVVLCDRTTAIPTRLGFVSGTALCATLGPSSDVVDNLLPYQGATARRFCRSIAELERSVRVSEMRARVPKAHNVTLNSLDGTVGSSFILGTVPKPARLSSAAAPLPWRPFGSPLAGLRDPPRDIGQKALPLTSLVDLRIGGSPNSPRLARNSRRTRSRGNIIQC